MRVKLYTVAHGRSGDKGCFANIAIFAREKKIYPLLLQELTEERVKIFFQDLGVKEVKRYEVAALEGMNFLLKKALNPLRFDAQGKALAQALLQMEIEI